MPGTLSIRDVEKQIISNNLPLLIRHNAKQNRMSLKKLSTMLGKTPNYMSQQVNRKNISVAVLLALSTYFNKNLFEPIQNHLPDDIRATAQEKALQQQIVDLQKQLADVQKERDLLKEIVMK